MRGNGAFVRASSTSKLYLHPFPSCDRNAHPADDAAETDECTAASAVTGGDHLQNSVPQQRKTECEEQDAERIYCF